jgi:4-hydroxy 2-oxovalerate aldolase
MVPTSRNPTSVPPAIKGIIKKMQDAKADIIECGWLKDKAYEDGTTFFHVPADLEPYLLDRKDDIIYVTMIDYNRYDVSALPPYDGKSIDAIRVVFPLGKQGKV